LLLILELVGAEAKQLPSIPGIAAKQDTADALDQQNIPYCVVNSLSAFFYLTQSGLETAGAVDDCPEGKLKKEADRLTCASDVFGVLQSFLNTGSLIQA